MEHATFLLVLQSSLESLNNPFMCMCVRLLVCRCSTGRKRAANPPEQEWQAVVSQLTRVLGTEVEAPAGAQSALNHQAISPAQQIVLRKD